MSYSHWEDESIKEIQQYLGKNCKCGFLGFSFNNRNTTPINSETVKNFELILGYDSYYDIYAAWNPYVHQNLRGKEHTFGCGKIRKKDIRKFISMYPIYKSLQNNGYYEKMVLIKSEYIKEFCKNYSLYLYPDKSDKGFNEKVICGFNDGKPIYLENSNLTNVVKRNRYTCTGLERSATFRKNILEYFDKTCIVCGCKEIKLLQAAHITPVSEGGSDDVSNGYCLCANHHLLFDVGKLEIDAERGTFHCKNTSEVHSLWYNEAEKRNFKLFLPNDMEEK